MASGLIQRTDLKLIGDSLTVSAPEVFKWDGTSVEVHGVDDSTPDEVLKLVFESEKKTGGGPLSSIDRHPGFAVLHFQNSTGTSLKS